LFIIKSAKLGISIFILLFSAGCIKKIDDTAPKLAGKYLGQTEPQQTIQIFAPGLVSTRFNERDAAFSPDGNEFYFTLSARPINAMVCLKQENGRWTLPEVASFSGNYSDLEPAFSPDGNRLYFVSNRPTGDSGEPKDYDIWYVEKEETGWSRPVNLGAPINTDKDEFYPSLTADGTIYFTAEYEKTEDIYRSRLIDGQYQPPEKLNDSINNGDTYEFNAFIAPDESYIIFTSYGRDDDMGGGDLYVSFKSDNDTWTKAVNMGEAINSPTLDYCPYVSPDGRFFFFTSSRSQLSAYSSARRKYNGIIETLDGIVNGQANIYWVESRVISDLKK